MRGMEIKLRATFFPCFIMTVHFLRSPLCSCCNISSLSLGNTASEDALCVSRDLSVMWQARVIKGNPVRLPSWWSLMVLRIKSFVK